MKIEFICTEVAESPNSTLSNLHCKVYSDDGCLAYYDYLCSILEDGYRDKKVYGETRIWEGIYPIIKKYDGRFFESYNRRWGHEFVLEITGIENFSSVLVHTGNTIQDTDACPLTISGYSLDGKGNFVGSGSRKAYKKIYEYMRSFNFPDEMFWHVIRNPLKPKSIIL